MITRRHIFRKAGAALVSASLLVLEACMPQRSPKYEVRILFKNSHGQFSPDTLEIPRGATVVWQNQGIYPQTVTYNPGKMKLNSTKNLPQGVEPWDSGTLYPGQTWSYTFEVPGSYPYFSQIDEEPDLIGLVIVKT
jgi:plastocyanin